MLDLFFSFDLMATLQPAGQFGAIVAYFKLEAVLSAITCIGGAWFRHWCFLISITSLNSLLQGYAMMNWSLQVFEFLMLHVDMCYLSYIGDFLYSVSTGEYGISKGSGHRTK